MKKLTIASLIMTSSLLLSRIIGFVRDATIASEFGSGVQTDAYFAAFQLPDFLSYLVAGGAFSLTFIPIFTAYLVKNEEDKGWKLYSIIISIMTVVLVVAIIILEIFTPQIVKSMFPGFDKETLDKTILFTRIVLPAQLFFYNGGIISAILLSKKKFLIPALAPLIYNISIILFGLMFAKYGMIGYSIGALVGAFIGPFGLQFWALRKEMKFKLNFNIMDKDFINFFKKSLPIMLGLILVTLDDWLSKRYGSFLDKGTISYLNNSRRLVLVPIGLFAQANAQAILPFLSEYFAQNSFKKFSELARKSLTLVFFITAFASSWYIVFHNEIIRMVYQRGAYTVQDTILTSEVFLMFSLSIPFWASIVIISRFYYAIHNTRTPMIIGGLMSLLSLPLYGYLSNLYKVQGLALTVSIIKVLYFLMLLVFYKKYNKNFELVPIIKDLSKIILFFTLLTYLFYLVKTDVITVLLFGVEKATSILPYIKMSSSIKERVDLIIAFIIISSLQLVITLFLAKYIKVDAYNEFKVKYLNRILRKLRLAWYRYEIYYVLEWLIEKET